MWAAVFVHKYEKKEKGNKLTKNKTFGVLHIVK